MIREHLPVHNLADGSQLNTGVGMHAHKAPPVQLQTHETETEPTSAIHVPSGFTKLFGPVQAGDTPITKGTDSATIPRPASTLSHAGSNVTAPPESASTESTDRTVREDGITSAVTSSFGSSVESTESDTTVKDIAALHSADLEDDVRTFFSRLVHLANHSPVR